MGHLQNNLVWYENPVWVAKKTPHNSTQRKNNLTYRQMTDHMNDDEKVDDERETNNSGVCPRCWSGGDVGYVCRVCNMAHYAGVWSIDKKQREPCEVMFRTYHGFCQARDVYDTLSLTNTELVERFVELNGWKRDTALSYRDVAEFGVCAVMHCVGPRGGYCVVCDDCGISDSRLMEVEMEGDDLADYAFNYLALGDADGVKITRMIRASTDTTVGADCPTHFVSSMDLWELYNDIIGCRFPPANDELIRIFVNRGILCKIETVNENTATEGDTH